MSNGGGHIPSFTEYKTKLGFGSGGHQLKSNELDFVRSSYKKRFFPKISGVLEEMGRPDDVFTIIDDITTMLDHGGGGKFSDMKMPTNEFDVMDFMDHKNSAINWYETLGYQSGGEDIDPSKLWTHNPTIILNAYGDKESNFGHLGDDERMTSIGQIFNPSLKKDTLEDLNSFGTRKRMENEVAKSRMLDPTQVFLGLDADRELKNRKTRLRQNKKWQVRS